MGVAATRRPPLRSALYECDVMHHRLAPKEHRFCHRIFMMALDLDEIDEVARRICGISHNRRNVYEIRDRDHLTLPGREAQSIKENITAWLGEQGLAMPAGGRITLVTLPRVFGHVFNPVSFYFCATADGEPLCAVAQVGNTFGEMKLYLLPDQAADGCFRLVTPKHFYVSPFSPLDLSFQFKLEVPGERLDIHIDDLEGDRRVLLSALTGRRRALTTGQLVWCTFKCPLVTLKVVTLIHWHAFRLWRRGVPWYRKAADIELQRDVFRPHDSLSGKPS